MKMKKFTAGTISEAYLKVKAELGEDALILQTRNLPAALVPFYNGDKVEVTAALDEDNRVAAARMPEMAVNTKGNNREFLNRLKSINSKDIEKEEEAYNQKRAQKQAAAAQQAAPPSQSPSANAPQQTAAANNTNETIHIMKINDKINENFSDMKKLLAQILATGESKASGGYAGPWAILYKRLVDSEVRETYAKDLLDKLKATSLASGKEISKAFLQGLADSFPVSTCETAKIQLFVGPTGAGKTTTIAKLAAYYSLEKKMKCSLITADTYRISAIDQLRAYAEIVGVDLRVVYEPSEIAAAVETCKYSDVILVDSAGRSQKNREHMEELAAFMRELKPDCTHLVLSAATKESDLTEIASRYKSHGISRLLFTKLDETLKLGNVFNVVQTTGIPVSYFTVGQSVPDDIETAQSTVFVKKLLEGSSL